VTWGILNFGNGICKGSKSANLLVVDYEAEGFVSCPVLAEQLNDHK
jgi:hypothetical protein